MLFLYAPLSTLGATALDSDVSLSDDDDDPYEELLRPNQNDCSDSSSDGSRAEPDLSVLNTGKARVNNYLLQNYWKRCGSPL